MFTALGQSLSRTGRSDEAADAFRQAVALDARCVEALDPLRRLLQRMGHHDEARATWAALTAADPPQHEVWYGYAEFCLFLDREDDYRSARTSLQAKFGESTDPDVAERTARAALLLLASGEELDRAAALTSRAASADRLVHSGAYPAFQFALGLVETAGGDSTGRSPRYGATRAGYRDRRRGWSWRWPCTEAVKRRRPARRSTRPSWVTTVGRAASSVRTAGSPMSSGARPRD